MVDQIRVSIAASLPVNHVLLNQRQLRVEVFQVQSHMTQLGSLALQCLFLCCGEERLAE